MIIANGARLIAAFPALVAPQPGPVSDGVIVVFERGRGDTLPGDNFHRWGSAWMRDLDASSWTGGSYFSTVFDAYEDALDRVRLQRM